MIVRLNIKISAECEDAPEEMRARVELSMAQFREGLEAVIAQKVACEFPRCRVEFDNEEEAR